MLSIIAFGSYAFAWHDWLRAFEFFGFSIIRWECKCSTFFSTAAKRWCPSENLRLNSTFQLWMYGRQVGLSPSITFHLCIMLPGHWRSNISFVVNCVQYSLFLTGRFRKPAKDIFTQELRYSGNEYRFWVADFCRPLEKVIPLFTAFLHFPCSPDLFLISWLVQFAGGNSTGQLEFSGNAQSVKTLLIAIFTPWNPSLNFMVSLTQYVLSPCFWVSRARRGSERYYIWDWRRPKEVVNVVFFWQDHKKQYLSEQTTIIDWGFKESENKVGHRYYCSSSRDSFPVENPKFVRYNSAPCQVITIWYLRISNRLLRYISDLIADPNVPELHILSIEPGY